MTEHDVAKVFDTILSIPGMNDSVKVDLRITRKNALLLNQIISGCISEKQEASTRILLDNLPGEGRAELEAVAQDFLEKSGLAELSGKLSQLAQDDKKN